MATKTKTVMKSDKNTTFASGSDITAAEHRAFLEDLIDSYEDFIGSYTTANIALIASPTLRQIVYDTTLNDYFYYNGTAWVQFGSLFKHGAGTESLMDKRATASSGDYGQALGALSDNSGTGGQAIGASAINSGDGGQAIGGSANNEGDSGQAIGSSAANTGSEGQALGASSRNEGSGGQAIGADAINEAESGQAIGKSATNRVANSSVIAGAIIIRKDAGETASDAYVNYAGAEVVILSKETNLKATGTVTVTIPPNVKVFINEVGIICTQYSSVNTQPTVSYGKTGSNAYLKAAAITTDLTAAGSRERETSLLTAEGLTSLAAEITIAATGTTLQGRFYFKGFVVEDE